MDIQLKRAHYPNELSKFRYDAVLRVGAEPVRKVKSTVLQWQNTGLSLEKLKRLLADDRPEALIVGGVPNVHLAPEIKAVELLDSEFRPQTAGQLRTILQNSGSMRGIDPEEVWALGDELFYDVRLRFSGSTNTGAFDVVLRRKDTPSAEVVPDVELTEETSSRSYTNNPLRAKVEQNLLDSLRKLLKQKLPDHMAPSEFVFLTTLPLTSNGKIDRNALPAPDQSRKQSDTFREPRNETERQLVEIWAEILRRKEVGIDDNFFQLGGHSLLATQVISRVRDRFKIQLPLRRLFEFPTIAELAEALRQAQREGKAQPDLQIRSRQRNGSRLLEDIDNLSAEQVDSLLAEMLPKVNANK